MKKLVLIFALLTIGNNLNAVTMAKTQVDLELMQLGIIGEDYKFTDKASEFFKQNNIRIKNILPLQVNQYVELISEYRTLDGLTQTYRVLEDLTPDKRIDLINSLTTDEIIMKGCDRDYDPEFLIANNYFIHQTFVDKWYVELYKIKYDKNICINSKAP